MKLKKMYLFNFKNISHALKKINILAFGPAVDDLED